MIIVQVPVFIVGQDMIAGEIEAILINFVIDLNIIVIFRHIVFLLLFKINDVLRKGFYDCAFLKNAILDQCIKWAPNSVKIGVFRY